MARRFCDELNLPDQENFKNDMINVLPPLALILSSYPIFLTKLGFKAEFPSGTEKTKNEICRTEAWRDQRLRL